MKNTAYILLGSNSGNRLLYFKNAIQLFEHHVGTVNKISKLYESESWGYHSIHKFLNQVVEISTGLSPDDLLSELKSIETKLGRTRISNQGYSDRTIDLDILFYNQVVVNSKQLTIPHPRLHLRRFTLLPLAEIAATLIHPHFNITVEKLLENCDDQVVVYDYFPVKKQEGIIDEL